MGRAILLLCCMALAACQSAGTGHEPAAGAPAVTSPTPSPLTLPPRAGGEAEHDDGITAALTRRLRDLGPAFRAVTVETWEGRVLLMGAVIKPEQRRRAEQLAVATPGCRKALNELVLAEDKALDLFIPNDGQAQSVRQALGLPVRGGMTVRVLNNVAFLLGDAQGRPQAEALRADAGEVPGIKWVVAHLDTRP